MQYVISSKKYSRLMLALFGFAALLYNSWPLGYLLNYKTARYDLASDLDFSGQPYGWLFILGDIVVGVILVAITIYMRLKLHGELWSKSLAAVVVGLFVFGLFTATSADAPNTCQPNEVGICAHVAKASFGPDGMESTLAALGLLCSLIGADIFNLRHSVSKSIRWFTFTMTILWTASGVIFLVAAGNNDGVHLSQQILLILSGLALMAIGVNIYEVMGLGSEGKIVKA
jgi:hypothetical protein